MTTKVPTSVRAKKVFERKRLSAVVVVLGMFRGDRSTIGSEAASRFTEIRR